MDQTIFDMSLISWTQPFFRRICFYRKTIFRVGLLLWTELFMTQVCFYGKTIFGMRVNNGQNYFDTSLIFLAQVYFYVKNYFWHKYAFMETIFGKRLFLCFSPIIFVFLSNCFPGEFQRLLYWDEKISIKYS